MKHNPYKVLIISCWTMLALCFVIQLFGADLFNVSTQNETFIKVCNFIDSKLWIRQICSCIINLVLSSLTVLAILQRKWFNKLQLFIFIPAIIIMAYMNYYNQIIALIFNVFVSIILPCIFQPKKWYRAIIGTILMIVFQYISILIKNISGITIHGVPFLIGAILQIDSFIMVMLYYLYSIRKEENKNG